MKIIIVIGLFIISGFNADSQPNNSDTIIYKLTEKMPEFEEGNSHLLKFISSTLKVPHNNTFASKIIFHFVIEKDGSLSNKNIEINESNFSTNITNELIDKCKQEWIDSSLLVLNAMPKWKAGMKNGKSVRVKLTIPLFLEPDPNLWKVK